MTKEERRQRAERAAWAGEGGADRSTPPDQGRPTGHAGGATGGGEVAARAGIKR